MSFWTAGALLLGTVASAYNADQSRHLANQANDQAKANAKKAQQQADEANNRANGKSPNTNALLGANMLAAKGGQSGTMLTGPSGIDPSTLTLGKSSLLGG